MSDAPGGNAADPFMDDGDDSDRDPNYVLPAGEATASEDENDADQEDAEDDVDIEANVAAYKRGLQKSKAKAARRPQRGDLRLEIQDAQQMPTATAKRKAKDIAEPTQPPKKPKASLGELKANWHKEVGVEKPVKKSTTNWHRSISSRASSTSATSSPSHASAISSAGDLLPGEFDQEEDESSLQAACAAKDQASMSSATMKASGTSMGITLTKKTVDIDVDGKAKRERKPKYSNKDLPFPADSFHIDLKHYHKTFAADLIQGAPAGECRDTAPQCGRFFVRVPLDLIDYVATFPEPFIITIQPEFKTSVKDIWMSYFSAYDLTAAVTFLAKALVGNWRSAIGKRAIAVVKEHMERLPTLEARRKWVAGQLHNLAFLYRDKATKTGSYRSDLFLQTFAAHLAIALTITFSYGFPIGAAALTAAALERALLLCKDGSLSIEGQAPHSFVPVPWAERAASYLPPILTLTEQKWQEIYNLARQYTTFRGDAVTDPFEDSTDGGESTDGYVDPRSQVVVSDDEVVGDGDNDGGPHGSGSDDGAETTND
ncbi:hypothetical protein B0H19DRAFT_1379178 [Mycena capillaripes]|nr:hypothetical protein B0H19DRAFT_1379178 [Mycena capillaripes]